MRIIRKLVPGDAGEIEQHFLGLGRDDRRLRFCGATTDSCIVQHCASIDWTRSLLLGCFVEGALVAVLSFWPDPDPREAEAEFAISVDRAQQNRGIGREMMQRALILAENEGWRRLTFMCLAENTAMRHLAEALSGGLEESGEEMLGAIPVPRRAQPQTPLRQPGRASAVA